MSSVFCTDMKVFNKMKLITNWSVKILTGGKRGAEAVDADVTEQRSSEGVHVEIGQDVASSRIEGDWCKN